MAGDFHNQGVDYTLFFIDALTPTSGTLIDLERSKWEYGRGFNTSPVSGEFVSGSINPTLNPVPLPAAAWLFGSALLGLGVVKRKKS